MSAPPRALVNPSWREDAVSPASGDDAFVFHRSLPGYRPTPLHDLAPLGHALGVGAVLLKDESTRFGLPAFKALGASWAVERVLRERPGVRTLCAASAGNHGRAVAHVAALRGLAARIFIPARAAPARAAAIRAEGAEVVRVDGSYEDAVAAAEVAGAGPGAVTIGDTSDDPRAAVPAWVSEGYATLFREAAAQTGAPFDVVIVPVGVGSLAAAAVREGGGAAVIGVEPRTAACVMAALGAGAPVPIETPGTSMAGLDCALPSAVAWPALRTGLRGAVTVSDGEAHEAMRELASLGLAIGDCGAAPLAALRALLADPACAALREAAGVHAAARVLLVGTEGITDPDTYRQATSRS